MTTSDISDKIPLVADRVIDMERYRSGHNEAVLKTVCPQGRVGSNPTLSVSDCFAAEIRLNDFRDAIQINQVD